MNAKLITTLGMICVACAGLIALADTGSAVEQKHRVVFQVISDGDEQWDAVLGNVENLREAFGPENTAIAVIAHGKGLGMLVASQNKHVDRMQALADDGVAFVACENTMRKKSVTKDQLLPFASTVDSGVTEIVRKQEQGWSYIKSGI